LEAPFSEPLQFREEHVCDPNVFTVPTGKYEYKKNERGRIVAQYPLCLNPKNEECGGEFKLPAGKQTLNGEKALCYVRSRKTSSDFERAKRQQIIIGLIKEKLLSTGTLLNFDKVNQIFDNLGDNVRTTMEPWEMKKFFDLYSGMQNVQVYQRVLENSEEGLLYNPPANGAGYILLPIGNTYDRIHEMAKNIFTLPAQSDIKPKN
jgi:anionic cell wall polymer biosynthesis LytR-Cps2A-Psr (LCP) family protein